MKKNLLLGLFIILAIACRAQETLNFPTFEKEKLLAERTEQAKESRKIFYSVNNYLPFKKQLKLESEQPFRITPPTDDTIFIDFIGSGDIQKSMSQGQEIKANTGLGLVFERYRKPEKAIQSFEIEALINIATTADTVKSKINSETKEFENPRDYGSYILNPISAKQAFFLNSIVYFGYPKKSKGTGVSKFGKVSNVISGFNVRAISSNNVWEYKNQTKNLGVIAFRTGLFHEFLPDNYRLTDKFRGKYSITVGVNYTMRALIGDISSSKNSDFRNEVLGTYQKNFQGVEFNFGFRLNNLRAEFQMPVLHYKSKEGNGPVEGLTNTQFLFSIKFVGGASLEVTQVK